MANFNGTICKSSSPFGSEMSAKTTKSKLFGKLASIPKSTSTFLRDILFRKSTALQIFSHWMWCLLTSNWIFAKKILWHQKQVFFYQVIHSELGIRIYTTLSFFPLDLLSRGYSTMKFDFASKRRLLSPLLIAQSFTL